MTLNQTVIQMVDFRQQPVTSHLVYGFPGGPPVAIDSWRIHDGTFRGYVDGVTLICLPADSEWVVYSRRLVRLLTHEEALRESIQRQLAIFDIGKEMAKDSKTEISLEVAPDSRITEMLDPGQYL